MSTRVDALLANVKSQLGYPRINIEQSDDDLKKLLDQSLSIISPYVTDTIFLTRTPLLKDESTTIGSGTIDLTSDDVVDVVNVFESPSYGYNGMYNIDEFRVRVVKPDFKNYTAGYIRGEVDSLIDRDFRFVDGIVYLDDYRGPLTLEVIKKVDYESLRDEQAISWVNRYFLALCKESIGRIRSKFKPNNIPIDLDGDTLVSEGQSDKERLESDLQDEGYGFFFALR